MARRGPPEVLDLRQAVIVLVGHHMQLEVLGEVNMEDAGWGNIFVILWQDAG